MKEEKKMSEIKIRSAVPDDAEKLLSIYAPYVTETAITFEYDVPSIEEFRARIEKTLAVYPYIVAVCDGTIVGYAYASRFSERKAYDFSVELSVYIDKNYHGQGLGRRLYSEMENRLFLMHVTNLYAKIAATPRKNDLYLTDGSILFHAAMGFETVGKFTSCAYKFGEWYDMVYMEKG